MWSSNPYWASVPAENQGIATWGKLGGVKKKKETLLTGDSEIRLEKVSIATGVGSLWVINS